MSNIIVDIQTSQDFVYEAVTVTFANGTCKPVAATGDLTADWITGFLLAAKYGPVAIGPTVDMFLAQTPLPGYVWLTDSDYPWPAGVSAGPVAARDAVMALDLQADALITRLTQHPSLPVLARALYERVVDLRTRAARLAMRFDRADMLTRYLAAIQAAHDGGMVNTGYALAIEVMAIVPIETPSGLSSLRMLIVRMAGARQAA